MKALGFALFALLFSPTSFATETPKPVIRVVAAGENFRFEQCEGTDCKTIGRDEGYSREELEHWKKFRSSTAGDVLPIMGFAAAAVLGVLSIAFLPVTVAIGATALALGGLSYFFWSSPQVQAKMPNDVYHEFSADPAMLSELKSFLTEVDQGKAVTDDAPRVLSSHEVEKKVEIPAQAPPSRVKPKPTAPVN